MFEARPKNLKLEGTRDIDMVSWVGRKTLSDGEIKTKDNKIVKIHKGLMVSKFESEESL